MISNEQFLSAIFGENSPFVHVTSFPDDPSEIHPSRHLKCWAGGYASRTVLQPNSNQYFTISIFNPDEKGKARRRKANFLATYVIVADDVREKLPIENVRRLPQPSYMLQTSPGSEQWGWILDVPCTERHHVENLLDGLVAQGLAPGGKDPGMKGVTRYVRLPEGVNSKAKHVTRNGGTAPSCRLLSWNPKQRVSIGELATPFGIDLYAERREGRVDGAADLPDHPVLNLTDIIHVKAIRSDGRHDITCPWVDEHTDRKDDGAAFFTNQDGSIGFKCHHGSCETRTGKDLLDLIEQTHPNFRNTLKSYQVNKMLDEVVGKPDPITSATVPPPPPATVPPPPPADDAPYDLSAAIEAMFRPVAAEPEIVAPEAAECPYTLILNRLKQTPASTDQAVELAMLLLKNVDGLGAAVRDRWHNEVKDYMSWTRPVFNQVLKEGREAWYANDNEENSLASILDTFVYVNGANQFFNRHTLHNMKPEAFSSQFLNIADDVRATVLSHPDCLKTDVISFHPGQPQIFTNIEGKRALNTWKGLKMQGRLGDPSPFLKHLEFLQIQEHMEHLVDYMAFTLQEPGIKINHGLVIMGTEGIGKDMLIAPIRAALGSHAVTVGTKDILASKNGFMMGAKALIINEFDAGNWADSKRVANLVKHLAAAPPDEFLIDEKYIPSFSIPNLASIFALTNETDAVHISFQDRRLMAVWSPVKVKNEDGVPNPEFVRYFKEYWDWLRGGGMEIIVNYLLTKSLAKFDPKKAPPVTDMLMDMQQSSEDPVESLIKICINKRLGFLESDIISANDIYQTLRTENTEKYGYKLKTIPSVNHMGRIVRGMNLAKNVRTTVAGVRMSLYVIRNFGHYNALNPVQIAQLYEKKHSEILNRQGLKLYKGGKSDDIGLDGTHKVG